MKRGFLCCFFIAVLFASCRHSTQHVERPKLVIGMVIDQMRWDYLYRYYSRFGNDGFRRLMGKGFSCEQTSVNYLPAFTAPGHSCIYTGSVPSITGMAANDWIDNTTGRAWYCTDDTTVKPVGGSWKWGQMSPRNMLTTTVTDELRLATNFRSRVFGISLKDRGSILPAGHLANAAYWYDDSTGNFFTSNYYQPALPAWLNAFNKRRLPDSFFRQNWTLMYDSNSYVQSFPDNNSYEGISKGEATPVFPHITTQFVDSDYNALRKIPAGNTFSLMMAKACIEGEQLGKNDDPDFLAVSLSSTDYAGHQYAPNSMEAEDLYLRLDRDIAGFLDYLDSRVGKGNYLLFLTADHGAAHNARLLQDRDVPAGISNIAGMKNNLNNYLKAKFGKDELIRSLSNYQVSIDEARISDDTLPKVKKAIRHWLEAFPEVQYVVDMADMSATPLPEPVRSMIVNGYYRPRSGSMQIVLNPGYYSGAGSTGTTHGTWNPYDAHIPLIWYGWHIPKGATWRAVNMTDIAATVAALLHIQMPNGCIGKVIEEVMEKRR